ncbi:MAG: hypothetical protein IPO92_02005 [Saprospiraceae bacterium]|nr:hypothetical protein [Saprospiraceae bacterium]
MKKYLANLFGYFLFTSLFYIIFIIISGLFLPGFARKNLIYTLGGNGFLHTRLREVKELDSIDLLILGSSRAYRGFDVRLFDSINIKTFNLGSSNQTPIQTYLLLERYINNLHPKIIIFEVNPDIFSNEGIESTIDVLSNDKIDLKALRMVLDINNIKLYNTFIYSVFLDITGYKKEYIEPSSSGFDEYIANGYVKSNITVFEDKKMSPYSCDLLDDQFHSFQKILLLIKSMKIKLFLIQSPITTKTYHGCAQNKLFDLNMKNLALTLILIRYYH